jgi:hypothetical protein
LSLKFHKELNLADLDLIIYESDWRNMKFSWDTVSQSAQLGEDNGWKAKKNCFMFYYIELRLIYQLDGSMGCMIFKTRRNLVKNILCLIKCWFESINSKILGHKR